MKQILVFIIGLQQRGCPSNEIYARNTTIDIVLLLANLYFIHIPDQRSLTQISANMFFLINKYPIVSNILDLILLFIFIKNGIKDVYLHNVNIYCLSY